MKCSVVENLVRNVDGSDTGTVTDQSVDDGDHGVFFIADERIEDTSQHLVIKTFTTIKAQQQQQQQQ